jgi:hypothetical protein
MALGLEQAERAQLDRATNDQARLVAVLADAVGAYVALHQAAVAGMASPTQILALAPDAQAQALRQFRAHHPDLLGVAIYDQSGQVLNSDGGPLPVGNAVPSLLDGALGADEPLGPLMSTPVAGQPYILLITPIRSVGERTNHALVAVLSTDRLAAMLQRADPGEGGEAYLVGGRGETVLPADARPGTAPGDRGAGPGAVSTLDMPTVTHARSGGERLVSAARVPGQDWSVMADIPTTAVLGPLRQARETAFWLLWPVLLLAVLGGVVGVHVLVRRMAFVTEVVQHTVFPGVAVAFVLDRSLLAGGLAAAVVLRRRRVASEAPA